MSAPSVQDIVKRYEADRVSSTVDVCVFAALAYHYATTIDEEVKYVWSQPRWKLGKFIFLTTRYSALILMAVSTVFNTPSFANSTIASCGVILTFTQVSTAVNTTATETSLWLCLYALLEGKPRYFYLVILMLLGLTIPIYVLQCLFAGSQNPISPNPLDVHLGWPCAFAQPDRRYEYLYFIAVYMLAARSLVAIVLGLVVFVVRYRRQKGKLIRVIIQEGGMYLGLTLVLKLIIAIAETPHIPVEDKYGILRGLNRVLGNVFAQRLLLSLRKVDDPGTQAVISSLAFAITPEEHQGSDDSELLEGRISREGSGGGEISGLRRA